MSNFFFLIVGGILAAVDGARIRSKRTVREDTDRPLFDTGGGLWSASDADETNAMDFFKPQGLLHERRLLAVTTEASTTTIEPSKSIWQKVNEFYSDNNNMAMYCVLPIIVLVYGGCSFIYCCWKCKRFLRRRKHKRLTEEDDNSVAGDVRNDLNQNNDSSGDDRPTVKTASGNNWDEAKGSFMDPTYKKTPLPWDQPLAVTVSSINQLNRQDSFQDNTRAHDGSYSPSSSRESSSLALERERDKLDQRIEVQPSPKYQDNRDTSDGNEDEPKDNTKRYNNVPVSNQPSSRPAPQIPTTKAADFSRFQTARPIEIVPISRNEYKRQMQDQGSEEGWDPLHNRPYGSRNSNSADSSAADQRSGRETSWSIRDEIMAKYDALTSLAMAKQTGDILRNSSSANTPDGHRPDTLKRKLGKKNKLIFIAE